MRILFRNVASCLTLVAAFIIAVAPAPIYAATKRHAGVTVNSPESGDGDPQKQLSSLSKLFWRSAATADASAALKLIENNHPGAAVELQDGEFQRYLRIAKIHVRSRLPLVKDFGGYSALMGGLSAEFHDGHIWSSAIVTWRAVQWPGVVLSRRNGQWFVAATADDFEDQALKGSRIVSCDGSDFNDLAAQEITFLGGDPSTEAQLISRAPYLLADFQNPFLKRPRACTFVLNGQERAIQLQWRSIALSRLLDLVKPTTPSAPERDGVSEIDGGYWIRLSTLEDSAQKVVSEVRSHQEQLRAAPKVVIDLRGNGGGDSEFAAKIATALVGEAAVAAAQPPQPACGGEYWRSSEMSLKLVQLAANDAKRRGDTSQSEEFSRLADGIQAGIAQHHTFTPVLPRCATTAISSDQHADSAAPAKSEMRGRLVLITDHKCFSSCLIATDLFRRLGALHLGEATDRSTRYMEVQEVTLPSGLRTFSSLLKVVVGLGDLGPFRPSINFPGDMADTEALRAWVATVS